MEEKTLNVINIDDNRFVTIQTGGIPSIENARW